MKICNDCGHVVGTCADNCPSRDVERFMRAAFDKGDNLARVVLVVRADGKVQRFFDGSIPHLLYGLELTRAEVVGTAAVRGLLEEAAGGDQEETGK